MDPQLFETMMQRFDAQDKKLDKIEDLLGNHVGKDEGYWKQIDVLKGQFRLVKWITGVPFLGGAFTWVWMKFH